MSPTATAAPTPSEDGRFGFGANWTRYARQISEPRIATAVQTLSSMFGVPSMRGKTFLDIGSGSGLFSLAAQRLGATVTSFDYDPDSVTCTQAVRDRFAPSAADWRVLQGSVLDAGFLRSLGRFDYVYSWGVLHHTGAMWQAMDNAAAQVAEEGDLFISIYNDQGRSSRYWLAVKKAYNALPPPLRFLVLWPCFVRLRGPSFVRDALAGDPLRTWREYQAQRGMSSWHDVVDWVGGLPFEVAPPDRVFDFHRQRGFTLKKLKTCGGEKGCNEFVFTRKRN